MPTPEGIISDSGIWKTKVEDNPPADEVKELDGDEDSKE